MKLIIQPEDGVTPLLSAIKGAKQRIDVVIFRADRKDIEDALKAAAARGVKVTALIAYVNRGGADSLRKLELRFLEAGIIVARSADDLARYHDKFILIDRRVLYVLSFNFTHLDIDHSRGFGVVTTNRSWVREGMKLFRADCTRSNYKAGLETFVVSPANSRKVLGGFLRRARTQLLIYDPKISDKEMLRILQDRAKAGVEIRIIGKVPEGCELESQKLAKQRLHTRTIIRDRRQAFIGSQSLRPAELDSRREVGLIIHEAKAVRKLVDTFEADWVPVKRGEESSDSKKSENQERNLADARKDAEKAEKAVKEQTEKQAELAVKTLKQELDPLASTVQKAVRKAVEKAGQDVLRDEDVKDTMKKVVKKAVKNAVKEAVHAANNV
ncbi:MAG: phospholipase D-like domain-containing protein [Candidatus Acidiferrales bacterium]